MATRARVLVVDDDPGVLRLVDRLLIHAGHQVILAVDGNEALLKLDASIDVLLCDKNLPSVPGTQVVLEARARFNALTIVLMTAAPEPLSLNELGLDGYLAKPFRNISQLAQTIDAAMARRRALVAQERIDAPAFVDPRIEG
jgi:CheY-like chemotaxis protein